MKSPQSGFAHAFLIIGLLLAIIGALGFIFWQNFVHKEPAQTEIIKITNPDSNKELERGVSPYANWKTFENPFGDQIKYPNNYRFTMFSENEFFLAKTDSAYKEHEFCKQVGECYVAAYSASLYSFNKQPGDTIESLFQRNGSGLQAATPVKKIKVDGLMATVDASPVMYKSRSETDRYIYRVNIDLEDRVVALRFDYKDSKSQDLVKKMLKTVRIKN